MTCSRRPRWLAAGLVAALGASAALGADGPGGKSVLLVLGVLLPALRRGEAIRRTLAGILVSADARGIVTLTPAPPRRQGCRPGGSRGRRKPGRADDALAAGAPGLLGKAGPPAYIDEACLGGACPDEPAVPEATSAQGTARTRD